MHARLPVVGHGLRGRRRGTHETGGACLTACCGAWFMWEATWDTRDGRCVLDHPLWGMVYMGGNVGCARWAVRAQPPVVGRGLHKGVGGATWEEAARRAVLSGACFA